MLFPSSCPVLILTRGVPTAWPCSHISWTPNSKSIQGWPIKKIAEADGARSGFNLTPYPDPRREVAEELLESIADETSVFSPEWTAEIKNRVFALQRGKLKTRPADEVFARLEGLLET